VGAAARRERLSNRRECTGFDIEALGLHFHATAGRFPDGRLAEIFIDAFKAGSAVDMAARDAGITASIALQMGADPDVLRHALCRDVRGNAISPLGAVLDQLVEEGTQ
jgi:hypothetical protein